MARYSTQLRRPNSLVPFGFELCQKLVLLRAQGPFGQKPRTLEPGASQRLFQAPAPDGRVVTAEQHLRDGHAIGDLGPRVLRAVEQPCRIGVLYVRVLVA